MRVIHKLKQKLFSRNSSNLSSSRLIKTKSKVDSRLLFKTRFGDYFWLNPNKYLDQTIIDTGIFEDKSTAVVERLVKKNDIVLDIGANIGYYTVIFSRLVSSSGKILAFEPTKYYRDVLNKNLAVNKVKNCKVYDFGLSNKKQELEIFIGDCSATIHWASDNAPAAKEKILLKTLDEFIGENPLKKLDFIKIDVDGHEPSFFEGAWETLERYDPIVLLEVNQENYLKAGCTAWDFYDLLKQKGYKIYSEDEIKEFSSKRDFLIKCANFAYSANIVISRKKIQ